MKKLFFLLSTFVLIVPMQAGALSCVPPVEMIDNYVGDANYVIVYAVPVEQDSKTFEYGHNMNGEMTEGQTGQTLGIKDVYQGDLSDRSMVYFDYDSEWGYWCTNSPPELNSHNIYVISVASGEYLVSNVHSIDSDIGVSIASRFGIEVEREPLVSKEERLRQLAAEIRALIKEIRQKLDEFRSIKNSM